jgi:putative iron-regulated protein
MNRWWTFAQAAVVACLCVGCGEDAPEQSEASFESQAGPVLEQYANIVHTSYGVAFDKALALQRAVAAFVADPTPATHEAARQAWLDSRPYYLQTEAYRFYGGPIDDDDGPEGQINAWPMDEAYVDYVEGDPTAGIVNDATTFPTIDRESLLSANLSGGEANVATGYHTIEFLLWGQDLSATGAGARPITDYLADGSPNYDRRAAYLSAVADLLVADLQTVRDEWAPDRDNYRKTFLALAPHDALALVLKGVGSLSGAELSGERMQVAYDTKSQEDEHSCFSDNTHVDHQNDELGIENVYLGRYVDNDGPGIDDLVRVANPALDEQVKQRIGDAKAAIAAIPRPFDQAILGDDAAPGRVAVKAAIDALKVQTDGIAAIADALNVELNLE